MPDPIASFISLLFIDFVCLLRCVRLSSIFSAKWSLRARGVGGCCSEWRGGAGRAGRARRGAAVTHTPLPTLPPIIHPTVPSLHVACQSAPALRPAPRGRGGEGERGREKERGRERERRREKERARARALSDTDAGPSDGWAADSTMTSSTCERRPVLRRANVTTRPPRSTQPSLPPPKPTLLPCPRPRRPRAARANTHRLRGK